MIEPQQGAEPNAEIQQIIKQLNSRKKEEREEAERRLHKFGPDSVQELLSILALEREKRKKQKKIAIGIVLAYILIMVTISIFAHKSGPMGSMGSMVGVVAAAFAISQAQKSVTLVLAQLEDVRTVGVLAEALEYRDPRIVQAAKTTLLRLLPQLKASDSGMLNTEQRAALNRALERENADLVIAILKALEQVGDSQALPVVQRLADGERWAAASSRIRVAAQECLPALLLRSEEERSRQTLLRASSGAETELTPSDMLLRPASGAGMTAPHELLRSTTAQADLSPAEPEITPQTVSAATSYTQQNEGLSAVTVGHQGQVV
jgi:hypothetical protein